VEELLNRNQLSKVEAALNAVPQKLGDNPSVYFFKGRFAWQSIQTGDNRYSVDDARRYWESAAKEDSIICLKKLNFVKADSILYRLFQEFPSIFFELIGEPAEEANVFF